MGAPSPRVFRPNPAIARFSPLTPVDRELWNVFYYRGVRIQLGRETTDEHYDRLCDEIDAALAEQERWQIEKIRRPARKINSWTSSAIRSQLWRKRRAKQKTLIEERLGYSIDTLRAHLEALFVEGMSWDNHGAWHIDHKRPLSSFKITTFVCRDFRKAWALQNLQPLWAVDNMRKGARWSEAA